MFVSTFCIFFPGNVKCFWLQNMHVTNNCEVGDGGYRDNTEIVELATQSQEFPLVN